MVALLFVSPAFDSLTHYVSHRVVNTHLLILQAVIFHYDLKIYYDLFTTKLEQITYYLNY